MTDEAFQIISHDDASRWLLTADHASNRIPNWVNGGSLGLPVADMNRHIAYDPGSRGLTLALAEHLNARAITSNFSRLVIDPNRGIDDPTVLMKLYDGSVIQGNRSAGDAERQERLDRLWRPYHDALETLAMATPDTAICAIHSFTPQLKGRPRRPWQVGVLFSYDERLSRPFIDLMTADREFAEWVEHQTGERLCIGENEPYGGHLDGDSIDQHALRHGRLNILIELRNDLIETEEQQRAWAAKLAPILSAALEAADRAAGHKGH